MSILGKTIALLQELLANNATVAAAVGQRRCAARACLCLLQQQTAAGLLVRVAGRRCGECARVRVLAVKVMQLQLM
jgi:hypothetical protein